MVRVGTPLSSVTLMWTVRPEDLASALACAPGEAYPPVFATPSMIALMELAAGRCLQPLLGEDELSVGVTIQVRHLSPTPPGVRVTVTARYLGTEGKLYRFEVVATDPAGEIGRGVHERAIVTASRLLEGAERRRRSGTG